MSHRHVPLILIASLSAAFAGSLAQQLRREGNVVYVAHSANGCLRVATSIGPDLVLLDPGMPSRLEKLIKAHPTSADARVLHLTSKRSGSGVDKNLRPPRRESLPLVPPSRGDPPLEGASPGPQPVASNKRQDVSTQPKNAA
jgi:CheY-like chemotaxis protein